MILTHIDLFSGIGGFALAARWAGLKTIQFVELDKFCCKVLNKNFPGVPIHNDIKTFRYNETSAQPFLLTGGFPCQPFSCAGKQRGTEDNRYLWPEMLRVISETKPRWIIGENVRGFISNNNGMVFENCCLDLEREGYAVQAFIIPACSVNAPHRRDRVWIVGHSASERLGRGCENSSGIKSGLCGKGFKQIESNSHAPDTLNEGCIRRSSGSDSNINGIQEGEQTGSEPRSATSRCDEIPLTDTPQRQNNQRNGRSMDTPERSGECSDSTVRLSDKYVADTESINEKWAIRKGINRGESKKTTRNGNWCKPWLEVASRLCVMDDELSSGLVGYLGITEEHLKRRDEHRVQKLKALGNAIVPSVAYEIMKAILEAVRSLI